MIPSLYGQLAGTGAITDPIVQAAAAALAAQTVAEQPIIGSGSNI